MTRSTTVSTDIRTIKCRFCAQRIMWLRTRMLNVRLPFNAEPVSYSTAGQLPDGIEGWIPGKWKPRDGAPEVVVMAQVTHYSQAIQEATHRVWTVHTCSGSRAHLAQRLKENGL